MPSIFILHIPRLIIDNRDKRTRLLHQEIIEYVPRLIINNRDKRTRLLHQAITGHVHPQEFQAKFKHAKNPKQTTEPN